MPDPDNTLEVVARCGVCEGELFMLTCHHAHGTGHEWALASICVGCRTVHWIESGCPDCKDIPAEELPW